MGYKSNIKSLIMESKEPVEHLVVDSSVLIRKVQLKDVANNVYSTDGVVNEIKDENTRRSLQVLPYVFSLKQPHDESIKFVTDFSKSTGDYASLSDVDIGLIALSYQLSKENSVFQIPMKDNEDTTKSLEQIKLDKKLPIAGFYFPSKNNNKNKDDIQSLSGELNSQLLIEDNASENSDENGGNKNARENEEQMENGNNEGTVEDYNAEEEEDDDDSEGWICPSNIKETLKNNDKEECSLLNQKLKVACMTADYSMQNVLLQLGIPVLSVDGLLIRKIRNYVLRCYTCRKITTNTQKQFCPKCGYKTLERAVETVDHNGNKSYSERRKPRSTKGLKFALPAPKGGKHVNYPILSEDQPRPHNFPSKKALAKTNPLDSDYLSLSSPFAMRDVNSKAAHLGIKPLRNGVSNRK